MPALGQDPGLPPRREAPFVHRGSCAGEKRKDPCVWEPESALLRVPRPTPVPGPTCWAGCFVLGSAQSVSRAAGFHQPGGLPGIYGGLVRCGGRPAVALAGAEGRRLVRKMRTPLTAILTPPQGPVQDESASSQPPPPPPPKTERPAGLGSNAPSLQ